MAPEPSGDDREPDDAPAPISVPISVAAAEQYLRHAHERALTNEAELTANGYRFLTVEHGDPEDDEQMALLNALRDAAWDSGRVHTTQGGNDYVTIHIAPPAEPGQPGADAVLDRLELRAHELNPGWWRIRRTAR